MGVLEDALVLDPQADQGVDVEEAAIVELLARRPPVGQAVVLPFQQRVELGGRGVDLLDLLVDGLGDLAVVPAEPGQSMRRRTSLSRWRRITLGGVGGGREREVAERVGEERQLVASGPGPRPAPGGR